MFGHGSSAFSANNNGIEVIDPCNRTGKIVIPNRHVQETRGVQLWRDAVAAKRAAGTEGRSTKVMDLSLCLLFQKGKCNAGSRCNQVHADSVFIETLRQKASTACNCCAEHGDVHSEGLAAESTLVIIDGMPSEGQKATYHIKSCARTKALEFFLRQASRTQETDLIIPSGKICRLHSLNRCKFGRDCKNIHICHKAIPIPTQPKPTAAVAKALPKPVEPLADEPKPLRKEADANSSISSLSAATQIHLADSSIDTTPHQSVAESPLPLASTADASPPPLCGWSMAKSPFSVSDAWDFNVFSLTQHSGGGFSRAHNVSHSSSSSCAPLDVHECSFSQRELEAFVADLTACQPSPLFVSPQYKQ